MSNLRQTLEQLRQAGVLSAAFHPDGTLAHVEFGEVAPQASVPLDPAAELAATMAALEAEIDLDPDLTAEEKAKKLKAKRESLFYHSS